MFRRRIIIWTSRGGPDTSEWNGKEHNLKMKFLFDESNKILLWANLFWNYFSHFIRNPLYCHPMYIYLQPWVRTEECSRMASWHDTTAKEEIDERIFFYVVAYHCHSTLFYSPGSVHFISNIICIVQCSIIILHTYGNESHLICHLAKLCRRRRRRGAYIYRVYFVLCLLLFDLQVTFCNTVCLLWQILNPINGWGIII